MAWSQLLQMLLSFGFVIALMLGLSHLVRRFGLEKRWQTSRSSSGGIHLLDSLFLDAKRRIVIVGMAEKRYALLLDGERAQVMDILPDLHDTQKETQT
jgi:flagellar biogenesis protein FliO